MANPSSTDSVLGEAFAAAAETAEDDLQWRQAQASARLFGEVAPVRMLGHFELRERIGEGAIGSVHRAHDRKLGRDVAVKRLKVCSDKAHRRFEREARALAQLSHPNIVQIYEVGREGSTTFIAMEYVEGTTLTRWLDRPRPWRVVVEMFIAAGEGLAAAHAAGLIHRDFKPDNVIVGADGRARVVDFGLARSSDSLADSEETLSKPALPVPEALPDADAITTGGLAGTPAYMAPEQHIGQALTDAADQFSFCVALFEGIYRARPFRGGTRWALVQQTTGGEIEFPPIPPSLPAALVTAIHRGLAPRPHDRHRSMEALLDELRAIVAPKRRRRLALATAAGLVPSLVVVGWLGLGAADPPCEIYTHRAQGEVDPLWTEQRRQDTVAALRAASKSWGTATAELVDKTIPAWSKNLARAQGEACTAYHIDQRWSATRFDTHMECLLGQQRKVEALLEQLGTADDRTAARVPEALTQLPMPSSCSDAAGRFATEGGPAAFEARALLAEAEAAGWLGNNDAATTLAGRAERAADQAGSAELVRTARILATITDPHLDTTSAAQRLQALVYEGLAAGHDTAAAQASLALARLAERDLESAAAGRQWIRLAAAQAQRLAWAHDDHEFWADVRGVGADLDRRAGEFEEAARVSEQLVAWRRARLRGRPESGVEALRLASTLHSAAAVDHDRHRFTAALTKQREALRLEQRHLGEHHPRLARGHYHLGVALHALGRDDDARTQYERVVGLDPQQPRVTASKGLAYLALVELDLSAGDLDAALDAARQAESLLDAALPPGHPDRAAYWNTFAVLQFAAGDLEGSKVAYQRAIARYEAIDPEGLPVAIPASNLGETLVGLGQFERALPWFDRAEAILLRHHADGGPDLAYPLKGRGLALVGLHRPDEAIEPLQRAWALYPSDEPLERGEVALGLGLAMALSQRSPSVARRYAEHARSLLANDPLGLRRMQRLLRVLPASTVFDSP